MVKQNLHYVMSQTTVSPERLFAATLLPTNFADLKPANNNGRRARSWSVRNCCVVHGIALRLRRGRRERLSLS